jgi:hypothetical protein
MTLTEMYGLVEIEKFAVQLLRDTVRAITVLSLIIGFVILYNNQILVFSGVSAPCSG